jgi:hypothetical protein
MKVDQLERHANVCRVKRFMRAYLEAESSY